jgi:hypothetical protein
MRDSKFQILALYAIYEYTLPLNNAKREFLLVQDILLLGTD